MTNVLMTGNLKGSGIRASGGTARLMHCTLAGNTEYGIYGSGGNVALSHTILSGNASAGTLLTAGTLTIDYSCLQESYDGPGNFVADPLFADAWYCHARSRAGHFTGGFFDGGAWDADPEVTSPPTLDDFCITAYRPAVRHELLPVLRHQLDGIGLGGPAGFLRHRPPGYDRQCRRKRYNTEGDRKT